MMKLSDVLFDVDMLIPNSILLDVKLRWVSQLRRQVYRELPFDEAVYPFTTEIGVALLEPPNDCPSDTITNITINEQLYTKVQRNDRNLPAYYWMVVAGGLLISPTPTEEQSGFIYYKATPPDLTADDLDEELDFSADYHDGLFVNCCLSKVAKAAGELKAASDYDLEMQKTIRKMKRDMTRNDLYTIRVE